MKTRDRVGRIFKKLETMREDLRMSEHEQRTIGGYVARFKNNIKEKQEKVDLCNKTSLMFKNIADERNEGAKQALTDVLNYALANVPLEQRYEARIEETISKRSGKEMVVILRDIDSGQERSLKHQTGTALSQIVGFLMTVIVIKFSGASRVIVLDEKLSGLQDEETIRMFGDVIVALAKNEDFQIIMVEHKSELKTVEGVTVIPLVLRDYERGLEVAS
ncbi:hypothetical protein FT641_19925 [Bacillus paranthracis]|uniref:hypothetical protein n=1 Tax=Bacillus paranthracis TaxID=2026186 RepID=UPI00187A9974|nr:hypothetical protein [Bacillus paranthracis]MBE7114670.1 hypothetical protein [Bacillus paranthracis]MBE7154963.1 hypothetical protein [Bacillus paranthracis]